jgi:arginyl-tRNA synthetase
MLKLAEFPGEISEAAVQYAPHRLIRYVYDLAALVHSYYRAERIVGDDVELSRARLALLLAARNVIALVLGMVGVSAPERM